MDNILSLVLNIDTPSEMQDRVRAAARRRRIALGLTQSDLAARSGIPLATLKRLGLFKLAESILDAQSSATE